MHDDPAGAPAFPNAAIVSERWLQWRRSIDITDYDARFVRLAAEGGDVHGEADFIAGFAPRTILDAGCGTGRIAIELARRGFDVVGVDLDADMIAAAIRKAPAGTWLVDDLARMQLAKRFDLVAMPGNVMIFCEPDDRRLIVHNLTQHLLPGGRLVAGFTLEPGGYTLDEWDAHCYANGLTPEARYSTWAGDEYAGGTYHVSVHRRTARFTVNDLVAEARQDLHRMEPKDVADAVAGTADIVVVDSRQQIDRDTSGFVPGSIHLPRTVLEWRIDPASGFSNSSISGLEQRIVVYCNDGYSSSLAAANLQRLGFENATDMIGGFAAWRRAGLPVAH
jgi:rhodanese-related sulfurtransferase